jgi:hypothetical protein
MRDWRGLEISSRRAKDCLLSNYQGFSEQSHTLKLPSALVARQEFNQKEKSEAIGPCSSNPTQHVRVCLDVALRCQAGLDAHSMKLQHRHAQIASLSEVLNE